MPPVPLTSGHRPGRVRRQGLLLSVTVRLFWIVAGQTSVLRNFPSWVNGFFIMRAGDLWLDQGQCAELRDDC